MTKTPKRPSTSLISVHSPKQIKLDIESFRCVADLQKMLENCTIVIRIRNVSYEREVKLNNKNTKTFHMDGFDKNSTGIRIVFFDKMAKKWDNLLYVSTNIYNINTCKKKIIKIITDKLRLQNKKFSIATSQSRLQQLGQSIRVRNSSGQYNRRNMSSSRENMHDSKNMYNDR